MDCSVRPSQKYEGFSLVSTTDFFYPLIESPYEQGRIACANVLSDMYSMGVTHIDSVLMILAASLDMDKKSRMIVTREMIRGFDDLAREAGTEVTGGQSVLNPWPIIGGVAKSICRDNDIIMPRHAVAGDVLVLTKPLGTQVAVNAKQWMGQPKHWQVIDDVITRDEVNYAYDVASASMSRLNRVAAQLMHKYKAHAGTDVTGFGILGHANNLASNQNANVDFVLHTLPVIAKMDAVNAKFPFRLLQGYSSETSGGLLIAMAKEHAEAYCAEMEEREGWPCYVVGDVVARRGDKNEARVIDEPKVVQVNVDLLSLSATSTTTTTTTTTK
eukprot:TRINITY_DN65842_c6_g5_i13.p1 TRINITY_DN65842_c6_g5~~TRINITY_DN65842_c6_g5_i13.p1  ORF type:complete len:329 (-),score=203.93 TRINITY_DN65842_c6_g5_i13:246-1232(-)